MLQKIDAWHKTREGLLVFGLVEAIAAYIMSSLAIDSGSLIQWTLTFVLVIGVIQNTARLVLLVAKKNGKK